MSRLTTRDKIWSSALKLREEKDAFQTKEVLDTANLSQSQHRTTRRVLHSMKSEGWLEHKDSTDIWWKPAGTAQTRPSTDRLKGTDVSEACSDLIEGEVLEVIIHRVSHGGNLIAYPKHCEYDGSEDGIHIKASKQTFEAVSEPVSAHGLVVKAKVEMQSQKIAELVEITGIHSDPSAVQSDFLDSLDKLESLSNLSFEKRSNETVETSTSDLSGSVEQEEESIEQSESITREPEEPDLPPEPKDDQVTQLYYVATNKSECYHRTRSCKGINRREGELVAVRKEKDGEVPEEISNRRKCHLC